MSPASYGDTTAEYVAVHDTAGLIPGRYDVVRVVGGDAVGFLQDILSQEIAGLDRGEVARSFLLQPQGKLVALLWVLRGDEEVILLADPGYGGATSDQLRRFLIRVDATVDQDGEPAGALVGPSAAQALRHGGLPMPDRGWQRDGNIIVARLSPAGSSDRFAIIGAHADMSGLPMVGEVAATALRVEAGEPMMGIDVDERTIPQETGLVAESVAFDKGCYLGQELVARIDSRGHVNRRLVAVQVLTNVMPPAGSEVVAGDDRVVGHLTSPAESLALRSPIGLCLLRREVEIGSSVQLRWPGGTAPARVLEVPVFTDS